MPDDGQDGSDNDDGFDKGSGLTPDFMSKLRAKVIEYVLKNTEDVGERFPDEARQIHYGEAPERPIRGQASREEVDELREEGIEVVALPIAPVPPEQLH